MAPGNIDIIFPAVASASNFILFLILLRNFYVSLHNKPQKTAVSHTTVHVTIGVFLINFIGPLLWCLSNLAFFPCNEIVIASSISYGWCKMSAYIFMTVRLVTAFGAVESLKYSTCVITSVFFTLLFVCFGFSFLVGLQARGFPDKDGFGCSLDLAPWVFIVGGIIDFTVSLTLMLMFIHKIRQVAQLAGESNRTTNRRILSTLRKVRLLSGLAIFSTILLSVMAFLFGLSSVWFSVDIVVNMFCIFLTFKFNNGLYSALCSRCQADAAVEMEPSSDKPRKSTTLAFRHSGISFGSKLSFVPRSSNTVTGVTSLTVTRTFSDESVPPRSGDSIPETIPEEGPALPNIPSTSVELVRPLSTSHRIL